MVVLTKMLFTYVYFGYNNFNSPHLLVITNRKINCLNSNVNKS